MDIDKELRERLQALIVGRLGDNLSADITIESISVSDAAKEIHIVVRIMTEAQPEEIADRYFGLTGKVRETLGEKWNRFFPIITPNIGHSVNA